MKKNILLPVIGVLLTCLSWGQTIGDEIYSFTINGNPIRLPANLKKSLSSFQVKASQEPSAKTGYYILQFHNLPSEKEQEALEENGVELYGYLQGNAYYASVSNRFFFAENQTLRKVRALATINPEYKIERNLANGHVPDYAKSGKENVKVIISCFEIPDNEKLIEDLKSVNASGIQIINVFKQVQAELPLSFIKKAASIPWVQNIQFVEPPMEYENKEGRTSHRANVLNSTARGLGYGLTGKGVNLGLWDGDVDKHIDFGDRLVQREFEDHDSDHGSHTCGTIAGAGILDPDARGMAPEVRVFTWNFNTQSNGLSSAQERLISLDEDGIEITSNSYGYRNRYCPNPYDYNSSDRNNDLISNWYPYFLYVFSVGNDQRSCTDGYRTTSKNLKNSLLVAAIDREDKMSAFSSFGPSFDGRLIPNISGDGVDVYSTNLDNKYGYMSGTSMATPGVAGTMVLLYQRYKETHGGAKPLSSFMRALACNTATDFGNPGPDFQFGYGAINGLRAIEVMENNAYFTDSVKQGTSVQKEIIVPEGAVELRVMLAWTDPAATPGADKILVNDLDLKVISSGNEILPWVLDPLNPSANAVRGIDDMNNLEQVTILNPVAGSYKINISGTTIPDGKQDFAVVYDVVMPELKLTYPIGGETFEPGTEEVVRWNSEGYDAPFILEYSTDNGVNYTVVASDISSESRSYLWTVPTGENISDLKFRISSGAVLAEQKKPATIMPVPANVKIAQAQCDGAGPFSMTWDAVDNAKYEILKLNGQEFEHLAEVTTNSYDITGLTPGNYNYFSVRAIDLNSGAAGKRSLAVTVNPSVPVQALPFAEDFDAQKAENFYFASTNDYGKAGIRYINEKQLFGIRLEGAETSDDWQDAKGEECFAKNPDYIVKAGICNIDASAFNGKMLRLKFDYRLKYMKDPGTTYFRVKVNGNYLTDTEGNNIYGDVTTKSYKTVYYDLSAYAGEPSLSVEFEAVCKSSHIQYVDDNGSYHYGNGDDKGDFVTIDNIELIEPKTDIQLLLLSVTDGFTTEETIKVEVKNKAGVETEKIPVSYQVNNGTWVLDTIPGPLAPLEVYEHTFAQKADLSAEGKHSIVAKVSLENDTIKGNNEQKLTVYNDPFSIKIGEVVGVLDTCDVQFSDFGGKYNDYPSKQTAVLTFKPENTGKTAKVTFTEFDVELNYDYLYIYNGPSELSPLIAVLTGTTIPPSYTSTAVGGELTFVFESDEYVVGKGWLANIECVEKPETDIELTNISKPEPLEGVKTDKEEISFTVTNLGSNEITTYGAYFKINDGAPVKQEIATSLVSGTSEEITFDSLIDLTVPGEYKILVWLEVVDDTVAENNTDSIKVTSIPVLKDAGVAEIQPVYPARENLSAISAKITNYGTVPIDDFDVAYRINGGSEVTEKVTGPVEPGMSLDVTFATEADLTALDTDYKISVFTKLSGDVETNNDTLISEISTPLLSGTNVVASTIGGRNMIMAGTADSIDLVNNYTIECWVNLMESATYGHVFNKTNVSLWYQTSYGSNFYGDDSFILNVTTDNGTYRCYATDAVKYGSWQHLALTVSAANEYKLFIDGVEQTWIVSSGTPDATKSNLEYPIYFGNRLPDLTRPLNGSMDEIRIWDSELDPATIKANMMTDYPVNNSGLIAYYKLNEGEGSYVYDYSSNDNTAIIAGEEPGSGDGYFWNQPELSLYDYSIPEEKLPATYDASTNTINVIMDEADLTTLIASFKSSQNSVVKIGGAVQESSVTTNDFSKGVLIYTLEGVGFNAGMTEEFNVSVTNDLSSDCELKEVTFAVDDNPGLKSKLELVQNGNNFGISLPFGTDRSALKASFVISDNAKIIINNKEQPSPQTTAMDYSAPVMATVISENGRYLKNYKVFLDARNNQAELTEFVVPEEQIGMTDINSTDNTVHVWVKNTADLTMLAPEFTVSENAGIYVGSIGQKSKITVNDFTAPLIYAVVSEDESVTEEWEVTVKVDDIKPVITMIGKDTLSIYQGETFTDPGATAEDNLDGDISSKIKVTGNVNTEKAGDYKLKYTVSDVAGNVSDTAVRVVNVVPDDIKPVITMIGKDTLSIYQGETFTDPGATAKDNIDGDISSEIKVTGNVNTEKTGVYKLEYTVADAAGNLSDTVVRVVNVVPDKVKPVITLIGESSVTVNKGTVFTDPGATATDNIQGDISSEIKVTGDVNTDIADIYKITYTVSDLSGNEADPVVRTVEVKESSSITEPAKETVHIYAWDGKVFIDIPQLRSQSEMYITDILGTRMFSAKNLNEGKNIIPVDFETGLYIVAVDIEGEIYMKTIIVTKK